MALKPLSDYKFSANDKYKIIAAETYITNNPLIETNDTGGFTLTVNINLLDEQTNQLVSNVQLMFTDTEIQQISQAFYDSISGILTTIDNRIKQRLIAINPGLTFQQ